MSQYEFVMMMMSIIVGLGVTELLRNVARQIQCRAGSKQYWLHSVVAALIFFSLLQAWWESWSLLNTEDWNFLIVLLLLSGPIGIYIISHLLFPNDVEGANFEEHYYNNSRTINLLAMAVVSVSTIFKPVSFGESIFTLSSIPSLLMFIAFFTMAMTRKKLIHETLYPTMLILLLLDVLIFQFSI